MPPLHEPRLHEILDGLDRAGRQRVGHSIFEYPKIDNSGICVYCGEPAGVWDHFIPLVRMLEAKKGHVRFPACFDCNYIVGGQLFTTFSGKINFIRTRLVERYNTLLKIHKPSPRYYNRHLNHINRRLDWSLEDNMPNVRQAVETLL